MSGARAALSRSQDAFSEGAGPGAHRPAGSSVLYLTPDLLARHSEVAGGTSRLERLRIDGLRRCDRIRTLENLGSLPSLLHLELPCHAISSMAPVLSCSVRPSTCRVRSALCERASFAKDAACDIDGVSCRVACTDLQGLRTLNLSDNQITRLERLSQMPHLEVLDVSSNRIGSIPKMQRDHRSLRTVKLSHNCLAALADLDNLRALKNLSVLTLEGNPLAAHARQYAVFALRTLDVLDGETISSQVSVFQPHSSCWSCRCAGLLSNNKIKVDTRLGCGWSRSGTRRRHDSARRPSSISAARCSMPWRRTRRCRSATGRWKGS
jgi:hypothetical protein